MKALLDSFNPKNYTYTVYSKYASERYDNFSLNLKEVLENYGRNVMSEYRNTKRKENIIETQ